MMNCFHSPDVIKGMTKHIRAPKDELTVTELMDCPRALWLKKKRDYQAQPSKLYWSFRGQLAHKFMEEGAEPGDLVEKRLYANLGGYSVSGQFDLVRGTTIIDYKTTNKIPEKPLEHHVTQLSCYRLLGSLQEEPIKIDTGQIIYISMQAHMTLPVTLWPLEQTREWMIEKLKERYEALAKDEPPKFEDHFSTQSWKCGWKEEVSYCEVRNLCTSGQEMPAPASRRKRTAG
jgi:CRISPR/Cas system-associated exonuclease Cas4 (RecB family)